MLVHIKVHGVSLHAVLFIPTPEKLGKLWAQNNCRIIDNWPKIAVQSPQTKPMARAYPHI